MKNKLSLLILFCVNSIFAQDLDKLFEKKTFVQGSNTLQYRIMFPKDFDESKQYPLVLFLHGAGERGNNNETQLVHGSTLFANEKNRNDFPAIVIFPQCPKDDYWSNVKVVHSKKGVEKFKYQKRGKPTKSMELVLKLIDDMLDKPYVKKSQIYVGGLSMGGMGTFDILKRRPNMFAAAFPICGGGNPKSVKKYANNVSFWVFHGGKDDVVHPYFSLNMVTALQAKEADVKLTYFENSNHNSWDATFAEPKLLPWLFSNSKTLKNE
ncbi:prolyl oligopeptidase family serine peptidase [Flavivirga aquimarina]|uniref:Prolyl oligopeptidase family serine peptidase n=1 Tax=Flavivirga aquimarina TaxID=2027862 RepID=A0ABT8W8I1_9FLAO|nr:prolyl oligopeptidase family serine peptidase [Flavivirga aquimarina]MDO5969434.1 prolyl oligopeptidase family serine peptidase [Flavivirga aquimarina]